MTFYEPNPEVKETGVEVEEFADGSMAEPEPPASIDPTGEALLAQQPDDDATPDG